MAITNKLNHATDYVYLEGESTDTKPTQGVGVNSRFYELDTKTEYYFDGTTWKQVGGE